MVGARAAEAEPHSPMRVSRSSKTGVSMATAPWRLKTLTILEKACSRMAIWSGMKSRVPLAILGLRVACVRGDQRQGAGGDGEEGELLTGMETTERTEGLHKPPFPGGESRGRLEEGEREGKGSHGTWLDSMTRLRVSSRGGRDAEEKSSQTDCAQKPKQSSRKKKGQEAALPRGSSSLELTGHHAAEGTARGLLLLLQPGGAAHLQPGVPLRRRRLEVLEAQRGDGSRCLPREQPRLDRRPQHGGPLAQSHPSGAALPFLALLALLPLGGLLCRRSLGRWRRVALLEAEAHRRDQSLRGKHHMKGRSEEAAQGQQGGCMGSRVVLSYEQGYGDDCAATG